MNIASQLCPLCGGTLGESLLSISVPDRFEKAVGVSENDYLRLWRDCPGCGAAVDCPPAESVERLGTLGARYYDVDFAGGTLRSKFDRVMNLPPQLSDNAGRVTRVKNFLAAFRRQLSFHAPPRVLDIGAGLGVFLAAFLDGAWEGIAVEPDPLAVKHLHSLGRLHVVEGLFTGESQLGEFDLITLNKVVEHLRDPSSLLADVRSALLPVGGILYIEVPDRETIGRRPSTDNILGVLHWHLHSPQSLSALLKRAGLFPLSVERVFEPSGKISVCAFASNLTTLDVLASQDIPPQS